MLALTLTETFAPLHIGVKAAKFSTELIAAQIVHALAGVLPPSLRLLSAVRITPDKIRDDVKADVASFTLDPLCITGAERCCRAAGCQLSAHLHQYLK